MIYYIGIPDENLCNKQQIIKISRYEFQIISNRLSQPPQRQKKYQHPIFNSSSLISDKQQIQKIEQQNKRMRKESKKYNLALKKQSPQTHNINKYEDNKNLSIIAEFPESMNLLSHYGYQQAKGEREDDKDIKQCCMVQAETNKQKVVNIFQMEKYYAQDKVAIDKLSAYNVLCKKEVDAFKIKLKRIKNYGIAGILRMKASDSFLSSSRQTGTFAELSNNNQCITKQDLTEFYKTARQLQKSNRTNENHTLNKTTTRPPKSNIQSLNRTLQLPQMRTCHSTRTQPLSPPYNKSVLSRQHSQHFPQQMLTLSYKKSNSKKMLQAHRKKIEQLCKYTLKSQRQNIQPTNWSSNLRTKIELKNILDNKYVESIERENGFVMRGCNKLEKEFGWLQQRKNNYFEALESKGRFVKKDRSSDRNDDSRIINYFSSTLQSTQLGNKTFLNQP